MSGKISLVVIKPDAIQRGLVDKIEKKLNQRGLQIIKRETIEADRKFIIDLWPRVLDYEGRLEKSLVYLGQTLLLIWLVEGVSAVEKTVKIKEEIRGKYCNNEFYTLLHCPDTEEDFLREYKVLFPDES